MKELHSALKEVLEFENNVVKLHRAAGTRWISHKMMGLENMLDKFGLYLTRIENIISDTNKKTDKATLEGKHRQLDNADTVLLGAVFCNLLEPAGQLSLHTQKDNITLHEVTDVLNATRKHYICLLQKFNKNPDAVYDLPKLKQILSKVVEGERGFKYQGICLKSFEWSKTGLPLKTRSIINNIIKTLSQYFEKLQCDNDDEDFLTDDVHADGNDDTVLFHVANVVNTISWTTTSSPYENMVSSLNFVFKHFIDNPVISSMNIMSIEAEFTESQNQGYIFP